MKTAISIRYRFGVLVRVLAGAFGGYAFAGALAYTLARALPMSRSEAATTATLIGVLAMPAAVIWIFAVASARRALAGIVVAILLIAAAGWLLGPPA
jgi:hypothetical protein